mmetsp:Transcript_5539/g.16527  ORF Transcript_5539/g.16527 Transcript_5539/m.16527 type:complete len:263 (+) Transcript_5539:122-910(+)
MVFALAEAAGSIDMGHETAADALEHIPASIQPYLGGTDFLTALVYSFLMILATEIGDRTFFIAAIMAMKFGRGHVLLGALGALYVMTVLSAALGKAFPYLFNPKYTQVAAAGLFVYFGGLMLRDWYRKRNEIAQESEELHEVEEELNTAQDVEKDEDKSRSSKKYRMLTAMVSPVVVKAFTLTFLAEWGDRSQIATIALAAAKNVYGVTLGGILGHTVCTTLAVVGGRLLATRISEKAVLLIGGILFILFAGLTAYGFNRPI